MQTFRDFEQGRWEDARVCAAYHERLGDLVVQAVGPLLDAVGAGPGDVLLDVATGNGLVAAAAAARGAEVTGIDFSDEQLRRARAAHPGIRFAPGDADALPAPDAGADVVVCNFGVPHFPDPDAFVRDAARVLGPGGRLGYTAWATPERTKAFGAVFRAVTAHGTFDVGLPPGPDFFLHAHEATARASMAAAGFEAVDVATVPITWVLHAAGDALGAILDGTARTAALLRAQDPAALEKIRAAVAAEVEAYAGPDGEYRIPMPAVLVSGVRPGRRPDGRA